jgi:hypothetical protein
VLVKRALLLVNAALATAILHLISHIPSVILIMQGKLGIQGDKPSYLPAYENGTDSVPKRRHIKFRYRGITQKKSYNIKNNAKV